MKNEKYIEALRYLKNLLKPEDTIYGIIDHVSSSGMSRTIRFILIKNNMPVYLDGVIADLLDYKIDLKHNGLKVSGCGMDMIFSVVYNVSELVFEGQERSGYLINSRQL
jgi:hypothetical protein